MSVTPSKLFTRFVGFIISVGLFSGLGIAEQIVDTDPHVALQKGTSGVLPCRIQRRAYSVEWKRQVTSESESLVSLHPFNVRKRDGPGYEAGLFNITDDYSLFIKDVKVQNEGLYMCSFSEYQTGITFRNSTRVSVQAFPDEPFPVIRECTGKDVNSGACTLVIHQTSNLICLVKGYYPDIDLFFLHGSENVTSTEHGEWNNTDGTKNKNITILVRASDQPYQCVATGFPGLVGNRSVTVIVRARSTGVHVAAIVAPVLVVLGICLPIAVFVLYRRGKNRGWRSKRRSIFASGWKSFEEDSCRHSSPTPKSDNLGIISINEDSCRHSTPIPKSDDVGIISINEDCYPHFSSVWKSEGFISIQDICPGETNRISLSLKRSILRGWFFRGLFRPHDVIYHKGKYFITDTGHHCVSSYDPATEAHRTACRVLGSKLYGLASLSDPDQGILVTDNFGGRVYRIDNAGEYSEWASGLQKPTGITTHKGEVFVAEFDTNIIKKYNEKGKHLRDFDSKSYLKQPWFLAVNSTDHLYVADSEAIKVFTTGGIYQDSFMISNQGNWLNRGVAIDRYDNVFVTARDGKAREATETIAVFNRSNSEHRCVKRFTADIESLHYTRGLCINYDHNELAVVDGEWHRLKLFELYES